MTRIDFYIIDAPRNDAILTLACRLADKAVEQNHEVLINTETREDCTRLDELLWTFRQNSFLPHRLLSDRKQDNDGEPVLIGCSQEPEESRWELLINLAPGVPDFFGRFQRVAEIVGPDNENKAAGRERFRYYRDRGYDLQTHHV